jgi:hypothetical protein
MQVSMIGIIILGVLCVGLIIALFITCIKLRGQGSGRVGSADTTRSLRRSYADDDQTPSSSVMKKQVIEEEGVCEAKC